MWSFFVLVILLVVCEILPIIAMLDYSGMIGFIMVDVRTDDVSFFTDTRPVDLLLTLPSRQPLLVNDEAFANEGQRSRDDGDQEELPDPIT